MRPRVGAPRATTALAALTLGLIAVVIWSALAARPDPSRLRIGGRDVFVAGVNYPWRTGPGQDFGDGGWGHSGVSDPTTYAEVDADFANMAASGVRVLKWRVFGDGRYSPEFDETGAPTGLDPLFFPDLDAALAIALRHDLRLVLVLFDSGFWTADCGVRGVRLGGHADVVREPAKRTALVERVVRPLVRHLAGTDRIVAYEVVAEPDWGVSELHEAGDGRHREGLDAVRRFVGAIADTIHAEAGGLVTVEANRSRNMSAWRDLGLDYYSFSWYDWLEEFDPLDVDARSFGLDRPVVLGEFPVASARRDLASVLDIAYERGYAGAFGWSFSGIDASGALVEHRASYVEWSRRHARDLFADVTASAGSGLVPPPYALRGLRVRHDETDGLVIEADVFLRDREATTARVYATRVGSPDPVAEASVAVVADASGAAALRLALMLPELEPFKLSLGLFRPEGRLVKWFDGIEYVERTRGAVRRPELSALARENPCLAGR